MIILYQEIYPILNIYQLNIYRLFDNTIDLSSLVSLAED